MIQIEMDMPKYCGVNECPLCTLGWRDKNRYTEWCHRPNGGFVMVGYHSEENIIPDDCPLKEVKRGKWIPHEDVYGEHDGDDCSECGERCVMAFGRLNYCPSCGARMDEWKKESR